MSSADFEETQDTYREKNYLSYYDEWLIGKRYIEEIDNSGMFECKVCGWKEDGGNDTMRSNWGPTYLHFDIRHPGVKTAYLLIGGRDWKRRKNSGDWVPPTPKKWKEWESWV